MGPITVYEPHLGLILENYHELLVDLLKCSKNLKLLLSDFRSKRKMQIEQKEATNF